MSPLSLLIIDVKLQASSTNFCCCCDHSSTANFIIFPLPNVPIALFLFMALFDLCQLYSLHVDENFIICWVSVTVKLLLLLLLPAPHTCVAFCHSYHSCPRMIFCLEVQSCCHAPSVDFWLSWFLQSKNTKGLCQASTPDWLFHVL